MLGQMLLLAVGVALVALVRTVVIARGLRAKRYELRRAIEQVRVRVDLERW